MLLLESELHLDLALEEQERLSKEMSKKMENKKLFDESEFAILYLQEYIHSKEETVKKVDDLVKAAGAIIDIGINLFERIIPIQDYQLHLSVMQS